MSQNDNSGNRGPGADPFDAARRAFEGMADPQAFREAQAAMGLDPARMTEAFRTASERSVEQSREAYARMKAASDQAARTLESTLENAHSGSLSLSKRALESMRAQADLNFAHLERLASAKSFAEMIELQTSFVRRQIELATDQAREMQEMSQSAVRDVVRPARDAAEQATGKDAF